MSLCWLGYVWRRLYVNIQVSALVAAFPHPHLSTSLAGRRRRRMKRSRRSTVVLLQNRALRVVYEVPFVIRYAFFWTHVSVYAPWFYLLSSHTCVFKKTKQKKPNNIVFGLCRPTAFQNNVRKLSGDFKHKPYQEVTILPLSVRTR